MLKLCGGIFIMSKKNIKGAYKTLALADKNNIDESVSIPSEKNVEDAKAWVDFNEK